MTDPTDAIPGSMSGGVPGGGAAGMHDPHTGMTVHEGVVVELPEGDVMTPERILDALRPIKDPEIHISLVELGLVYGVDVTEDGKKVTVRMTLTGPGCPIGPQILAAVHATVAKQPGVETPDIQLVWDPQWNPVVHASEEAKDALGIW